MEDAPLPAAQRGNGIARQLQIDQPRPRREITRIGGAVGLLDARIADQHGQPPAEVGIRAGRRRPAQLGDRTAGGGDVVGERRQADVRHLQRLLEQ